MLRLTQPMPLARYACVVAGFQGFLATWEPRVAAALPEPLRPWAAARRRSAFAAQDGAALHQRGVAAPPAVQAVAEQAATALALPNAPSAFGSLYVIEGSTLGGQVLLPALQRLHGLDAGDGAAYFHGFGADTAGLWRDFRAVAMREVGTEPPAIAAACEGARTTFGALIALFRRALA